MANLLVINATVPWPVNDGNSLRVVELARHLPGEHRCHLACLKGDAARVGALERQGIFASVTLLPPYPRRRHWRRFFRADDRRYHRISYPDHFVRVLGALQDLVTRESVGAVVSVLLRTEEFGRELHGTTRVIDQYDCLTIALERELAARPDLGFWSRLHLRRRLARARIAEARLADTCDLITAIAPPDVARLRELTGGRIPVELVPNGVAAELLERPLGAAPARRAVAFWGNLAFPVNQLAVDWFYREVWRPYLQPEKVGWTIVGPNADARVQDLARRHPEITVPGFVDDLFGHLDPFPVMVNPMVSGTGLKNKVLEAFAVGKAVVTTPMGVEAFPVESGEHCLLAREPAEFAAAVLGLLEDPDARAALAARARELARSRYSWETVAARWGTILFQSGADQSAKGGGGGACSGSW